MEAPQIQGTVSLAFAATLTLDASTGNVFVIGALTGNTTFSVQNVKPGQVIYVSVVQDGVGGRTTSWGGAGGQTITGGAGAGTAAVGATVITVFTIVGVDATTGRFACNQ